MNRSRMFEIATNHTNEYGVLDYVCVYLGTTDITADVDFGALKMVCESEALASKVTTIGPITQVFKIFRSIFS